MTGFLWRHTMNPLIKKLEEKEIEEVYRMGVQVPQFSVDDRASHTFWQKDNLRMFAEQGFSVVIHDEEKIVGFLLAAYQPVTNKLTWENMYLLQEYRRRGLAQQCFQISWKLAQEAGARVAEGLVELNNIPSQNMLKRLGFENAGKYHWMLMFSSK